MKNQTVKKFRSKIAGKIVIVLAIVLLTLNPFPKHADGQPPIPQEHGNDTNLPPGGGAPVGSGLLILTLLGAGYAGLKIRRTEKNTDEVL
jgi:uncharacterized membrane protein